jgi:transforming growth factor-beta-induced protein
MLTISLLAVCSLLPQDTCPASKSQAVLARFPAAAAQDCKDIVSTAVEAGSFQTLVAAVKAADLVGALQAKGPFTVFAPTDEAFAKLPKGTVENLLKPENKAQLQAILKYHVVAGKIDAATAMKASFAPTLQGQRCAITAKDGKVQIDGANVVKTDIACSNGIIHVIDAVILPASKDLVDVAVAAGSFKTLAAALQAAGLVEALKGAGPFTVFAPTDAAFAKLPKGTVENLLKPENKAQLQAILKFHVVSGRIYSDDALAAGKATTLQGGVVKITAQHGQAKVNDAQLVKLDVQASNGVIHVIDSVILPPAGGQH